MTYHLHTENKANLGKLASQYFSGFTINYGRGYWHGKKELSATIEVDTTEANKVRALADTIKRTNHQAAVLIEAFKSAEELR